MTIKNKLLRLVFFVVIPLYAGYLQYRTFVLEDSIYKYERVVDEMGILYEDKMQDYNKAIIQENKALRSLIQAVSNDEYEEIVSAKEDLSDANKNMQVKQLDLDAAYVNFEKLLQQYEIL